jgi:hypothetical protein
MRRSKTDSAQIIVIAIAIGTNAPLPIMKRKKKICVSVSDLLSRCFISHLLGGLPSPAVPGRYGT